jgi:protein gp37
MAEKTGIGWTWNTFNPWWGCVEVSPACDHCYAREWAARPGSITSREGLIVWGKDAPRRPASENYWQDPARWNRRAQRTGIRERVFCASMADIGEERSDDVGRQLDAWRDRLWSVIESTPYLDWQLLTKRPRLYTSMSPRSILALPNVWPGVTCENADYGWRLDQLTEVECTGPRWVSYEPALGPLPWERWLTPTPRLGWVIIGGESGKDDERRTLDLAWLRDAVAACRAARIPVYVKQDTARRAGQQGRIPDELWIHEWPSSHSASSMALIQ